MSGSANDCGLALMIRLLTRLMPCFPVNSLITFPNPVNVLPKIDRSIIDDFLEDSQQTFLDELRLTCSDRHKIVMICVLQWNDRSNDRVRGYSLKGAFWSTAAKSRLSPLDRKMSTLFLQVSSIFSLFANPSTNDWSPYKYIQHKIKGSTVWLTYSFLMK